MFTTANNRTINKWKIYTIKHDHGNVTVRQAAEMDKQPINITIIIDTWSVNWHLYYGVVSYSYVFIRT